MREQHWTVDGGSVVVDSSSTHLVSVPFSNASVVDPTVEFVDTVSSCRMSWFLSLAAKQGWGIDRHSDKATSQMNCDAENCSVFLKIIIHPQIEWICGSAPTTQKVEQLRYLNQRGVPWLIPFASK